MDFLLGFFRRTKTPKITVEETRRSRSDAYRAFVRSEYGWRLVSSLSLLLLVVLLGLSAWRFFMWTERRPLAALPEMASFPPPLRVRLLLCAANASETQLVKEATPLISESLRRAETPSPLSIQWEVVDRGFRKGGEGVEEGEAALVASVCFVAKEHWPHFSATQVLLPARGPALIQVPSANRDLNKLVSRLHSLVWEVLVGVPHLEIMVKRENRERLHAWQIAAMPPAQQKRIVWDSATLPLSLVVRIVHVHPPGPFPPPPSSSSAPSPCLSSNSVVSRHLRHFASKIANITKLDIRSEHLCDLDVNWLLEEDVQGRATLTHDNLHVLIREIDSELQATESMDPVLKIVLLHSDRGIVILDQLGEDRRSVSVASWGSFVSSGSSEEGGAENAADVLATMRVLLGVDSELGPGWVRHPIPLSEFERRRLQLRVLFDNALRATHSISALRSLTQQIPYLAISDAVASRVAEAVSCLEKGLLSPSSMTTPVFSLVSRGRLLADSALSDPSLLHLLYMPAEQRFGMYLPVVVIYFLPTLCLLPRLIHFIATRSVL